MVEVPIQALTGYRVFLAPMENSILGEVSIVLALASFGICSVFAAKRVLTGR